MFRASEGPRGTEPRGPSPSAPTSGQRRCLGSGAGGLRRLSRVPWVGAPAHTGRTLGLDLWQGDSALQYGCLLRDLGAVKPPGPSTHRAGWTRPPQPFDPALCIFAVSAGRPRASPGPTVLLGDRAAVPCRPVTTLERGPTTHGTFRTSHRPSEPRVVLSGPPLAGTDTTTNEAVRGPVTRRTGESGPELRYDPGTVRAASSRARYRACRARRCSGGGSRSPG